ncbi:MAG: hypothetical protein ACJ73S_27040 [Mycobacteriales bacterium]
MNIMTRRGSAAILLVPVVLLVAACGSSGKKDPGPPPHPVASVSGWDKPADASAAASRAGLPMLGQEMLAVHYHAHVDVYVDGKHITVPAEIGIDERRQRISPLHTHDTSGVVHIESAKDIPFTLGQFFTEWGQSLTAQRVGPDPVPAGETLRVFRNGQPVAGDPAALKLAQHDEDVVWVGPSAETPQVPSSYDFPSGL